ncbi:MAG: hypothetical protein Q9217_001480 [Psora testacea]
MIMAKARIWTTTILLKNIHCASCVSYITALLAQLSPAVRVVDVNILAQEVRVVHDANVSMRQLCTTLDSGAFEVLSASSRDELGKEDATFDAKPDSIPHIDSHNNLYMPSVGPSKGEPGCLQLPRRTLHAENCDACKKEREGASDTIIRAAERQWGHGEPGKYDRFGVLAQSRLPLRTDDTLVDSLNDPDPEEAGRQLTDSAGTECEAVLSIGGMTCASCTSAVDHRISELPFVEKVNVTLMTNSAFVIFNGRDNIDQIVQVVEDLGYDCSVERCELIKSKLPTSTGLEIQQRCVALRVDGLFCKHCPPRILDALQTTYGKEVTIKKHLTLADPVIKIMYTANAPTFTIRNIMTTIDSIDKAFRTTLYHQKSIEQKSQAMQRQEQHRIFARLLFSFIVAIPTLLIGVVWMSLVPQANQMRQFLDQPVWSGTVARRDWALLILATPVMFFAADVFHVRAVKEIRALWRRGSRVPVLRRFYRFGSMNLLISAGTSVAYFSSIAILAIDANANPGTMSQSSTYFDTVVFLTFFILIGRFLEAYSKAKAGDTVAMLGNLKPPEAVLVTSRSTESLPRKQESPTMEKPQTAAIPMQTSRAIDADLLEVGDIVLVRHGSSPPADGLLLKGSTKFNESSLTGEAKPVAKEVGDKVYAGAVNVGGAIQVKVTEVGGASILDQIVSIVREGQTKRAPIERVVDVVTGYFVPVITALAIVTWIVWLVLGISGTLSTKYLGDSQHGGWAFWSLEFAIAVFVVACPCGIGLAAPTALFVGSGLAAKHGILVRGGGEAFQEASNVDVVVFDKTGTLTEGGNLKVTDHEMLVSGDYAKTAWAIAKSLEEISSHPIARAIYDLASSQSMDASVTTLLSAEEPGKGLRGLFRSKDASYEAALGSETFINSLVPSPFPTYFTTESLSRWKTEAKSIALLALRHIPDGTDVSCSSPWDIVAIFATTDPLRQSALPCLDALRSRKIPAYMLTGDNPTTASAVASMLSIPQDHVFASVLPTGKANKIRWLQEHAPQRSRHGSTSKFSSLAARIKPKNLSVKNPKKKTKKDKAVVAFIGDGINDAPALSTASLSISLSSASDIAMHSSSFILLNRHHPLSSLITLLDLSSRVFRRVKINFVWALVYNLILVPVAAGCLFWTRDTGWRLGPVWGSAAMAASSLCVVLSSLALRWEGGAWSWMVWRKKRVGE